MLNKKQFLISFTAYFLIRFFSFVFLPGGLINTIVSVCILGFIIYLLWKENDWGWFLLIAELVIGGVGSFLSVGPVALRTLLLVSSILIFLIQSIKIKQFKKIFIFDSFSWVLIGLYLVVGFSAVRGYLLGNQLNLIIADTIPYLFLLYYYPLKLLYNHVADTKKTAFNFLLAVIFANFIFVIFTFAFYSLGWFELHDVYYSWFRGIAGGKITDLQTGFWRVVLDEQLLLTPLILFFVYKIIAGHQKRSRCHPELDHCHPELVSGSKNYSSSSSEILKQVQDDRINYLLLISLLILLSINLSRIYILALLFGLLFLFSAKHWKRWFLTSFFTVLFLVLSFSSIHLLASQGKSLGWEIFGVRLQSVVSPSIEPSSMSRMLLLPKIWDQIRSQPLWGNGLGNQVTAYSPVLKKEITTPHYDWGYLEIVAETGIPGFIFWLTIIFYVFFLNKQNKNKLNISLLASILVINITSPALFHVMGMVLLVNLLINQKHD